MLEELRPALTDAVIRRSVGHETWRRGATYARQGRVAHIQYSREAAQLAAVVTGSAERRYRTVAEYDVHSSRWWGECSCPVGADCKHAAAILIAAQDALSRPPVAPPAPAWERALADFVAPVTATPAAKPIGLQFDVGAGSPVTATAPSSIRLRPVVPGAKGRWIRTGVSWRGLRYDYYSQWDPGHAAALRSLYQAHEASRADQDLYYYGSGDAPVLLEQFGPSFWPALRQLQDDGVPLVTTRGERVLVADEPATLAADLSDDAGGLLVRVVVELAGGRLSVGSVLGLGSPPHGVALVPGTTGVTSPDGGLLLVPLQTVSRRVERLVATEGLRVPAGDRARFLTGFYPALSRALPVTSSDGSVELPDIAPPQLVLAVTHTGGHRVRLDWSVQYRTGDDVRRVPLAPSSPDAARDGAAEDRLLRALPPPPSGCCGSGTSARIRGRCRSPSCRAWTPPC
ncbi:SWIM zinc finger family protein [Blastococcus sp. PRF04-17]|uniref:SWIM zinc finger family protein n=1 Tax=Blastococcus sp. PRF04-17 TaxID=2933797 RepID=UPI001FF3F005|nr:SWIM zinc finger family protein [Blastococcus sp. PRF04-17]UOY01859.1 SWIM zinc finger family protein [Blastococcus sp. PRF04-17]